MFISVLIFSKIGMTFFFNMSIVESTSCRFESGDRLFFVCPAYAATRIYLPSHLQDIDYCPIEIIKILTDKGQFQYLTKLKGSQEGTYLHTTQFLSL